ncbi:hypothetical protein [uncultured Bacteroides sp.]|uniref:hypothetical protein n=1 Tax=uncultured Bacteroides sp. TaxID=162156 RepID=UPI002AA9604C|nr:hypothetical protein [uncultured Bacteroides sp.]
MAYQNNYSYNQGGFNRGFGNNYQRRPNYNNGQMRDNGYQNSYNANNRGPAKKKSGATFKRCEDGTIVVSAWFVKARQLFSVYARPYKGTKEITSKSGKVWLNYFVTMTNKTTMQESKTSALFDAQGSRLYIKDFNIIATKGGRGGYCGTHIKK